MKIAILLSTYNGSRYLQDFLNSLKQQTFQQFTLFIRDDGSTDETFEIIKKYNAENQHVEIVSASGNVGVIRSFSLLMEHALECSSFEYFMFADQDDVWLPQKIETTLFNMRKMENCNNMQPILVHSDLVVVDEKLKQISPSFWKYQNLNPEYHQINRLLVQNVITGCTMMVNRSLAKLGVPFPSEAIMHDWWLGLVASCFGEISYLNESTILYRQHEINNIGAKKFSLFFALKRMFSPVIFTKNYRQAQCIVDCYDALLNEPELANQLAVLKAFQSMKSAHYFNRIKTMIRFKFFKQGILRNIGFLIHQLRL
ncbi:glycosyltransferase family 2 protein [Gorillibacterium massiliense]|uniref:glycosyltransferase family 2 protein n=1 Tax=Gorillibacterium massiliense TaxID=1280390 RepID=UPI0004B793A4|nr:glycosyltransferase family 2 protein [Gorillibacterium massiliense]